MGNLETLLKAVGITSGVGLALLGILIVVMRHYGEKWLESRFGAKLQKLAHEHELALVDQGYKISEKLDRRTRLHQYEFDSLPVAWSLLNTAFHSASRVVSPIRQRVNLDALEGRSLAVFLRDSGLSVAEIDEVTAADDKSATFYRFRDWLEYVAAQKDARAAYTALLEKGIFFPPRLVRDFKQINDLIWNALLEWETNFRHSPAPRLSQRQTELRTEGDEQLEALGNALRNRLSEEST